ncbi:MAG: hypothetical protein GY737_21265 [Desulfobacteraceae bacterium]|nr:hypothetical protein [Desulfobacteraceae bacterium]
MMNNTTAHIILGFFDVAALGACYYVFTQWNTIDQQIIGSAESITFQNLIGFYTMMIVVPVTHILSLFQWQGTAKKWANRFLIFFFMLMIVGGFTLSLSFKNKLLNAGYRYCASQSERMTLSEFKTYLREDMKCSD